MFRRGDRQQRHDTSIQTNSAQTAKSTSEDEQVHGIGSTTDGRTGLEEKDGDQVQRLGFELTVQFSPVSVSQQILQISEYRCIPEQVRADCGNQEGYCQP